LKNNQQFSFLVYTILTPISVRLIILEKQQLCKEEKNNNNSEKLKEVGGSHLSSND